MKDEGPDMGVVGNIDPVKYRCITDERIRHTQDHHPGHFEIAFLQAILCDPDWILEDAPNTGLLLKRIEKQDLRIQVVLRIHTSADPKYKKWPPAFAGGQNDKFPGN